MYEYYVYLKKKFFTIAYRLSIIPYSYRFYYRFVNGFCLCC